METFNHVNEGKSTSNMLLSEEQSDDPKYKRGIIYKKKKKKMQNVEENIFKNTKQTVTSNCAAQAVTFYCRLHANGELTPNHRNHNYNQQRTIVR